MEDSIPSPLNPEMVPSDERNRDPATMRVIVEHFLGKPSTGDSIKEYCNLNHFPVITPGELEDWTFAYEHDKRIAIVIPLICAELAKYRYVSELHTKAEEKVINKSNEDIKTRICDIIADNGTIYQEIELMTKTLATAFHSVLTSVGDRLEATTMHLLVEEGREKYGVTLPLAVIAEAHRARFKSVRTNPE